TDHDLALALWDTGRYEARMLASMIDDPAQVTAAQMNAWARDFDNWALVDTVCFHLFDRTKHAWKKIPQWAKAKPEFTKRTAFALIWSLSAHDKEASDAAFIECLPLIEKAAVDERKFVKKAVNMALRAVGKRNAALNSAAVSTAKRLAESEDAVSRWVGSHAVRELTSPVVRKRISGGGRTR
ncbi:MAG: DNA alkylation repair protein, partial [Planctomycetota bacterium]